MSRKIILRIESPVGTRRIQMSPSETTFNLFEKVHSEFDLNSYSFALFKQRSQKDEVMCNKSRTIADIGLAHGDMLYMTPINGAVIFPQLPPATTEFQNNTPSGDPGKFESLPSTSSADSSQTAVLSSAKKHIKATKEDEVDVQLSKLDGKIQRNRDEKLCHHTKNALCIHCCPLEPSNESYLREHNIKHMSFHSYLRKLTSDISGGKFAAMEDTSCRIKIGCKDHLPWPKGICSKCQPNAVTLNRQIYRHVDNIQFENTEIVERFLNYWRITGLQRFGFLYGNYVIHPDVPLGIKATVAAIYEPPQENDQNCIRVLKDDKEELVDQIAAGLGLKRVGYIFTDLVAQDLKKGTVKHTRNANTHFLTAQECITSGKYQNMHPNPTKLSSNGYYGSKFVTICVTGDKTNQVCMEGYQVSNQCMALVRDDCLVPTKDAPELGYVRESSDRQYVPDVFYKDKDSYGNEVPKMARPLPVEYLLVDVPASTPLTPHYTFNCDVSKEGFPIENRIVDGQVQDFTALARYMSQFPAQDQFPSAINDFHLLLYIAAMDTLPMKDFMDPLLEAIKMKNAEASVEWSKSEQWATVVQLIAATNSSPPHSRPTSVAGTSTFATSSDVQWTCPFCTFLNSSNIDTCEMCTLPRSSVPQ